MDRMGLVFILCVLVMVASAMVERTKATGKAIELSPELFNTTRGFKVAAAIIVVVLIAIYTIWW
jgi:SSS family solute:Na+ symporter